MNPILVFGVNADNAARAEMTLDWIYQLAGRRQKRNHILVAFDADCSPEQREKIKITADLAFESAQELLVPSLNTAGKTASEVARQNAVFLAAAETCQKTFRVPWLWLEHDSTPTNPDWLVRIAEAYDAQPRRYLATHLKMNAESDEKFIFRNSVYHMGAFNDMVQASAARPELPANVAAGMELVMRSTKCRLFQPLRIMDESDFVKVWPEAQIVVGDISGALIEHYRELGVHIPKKEFRIPLDPLPYSGASNVEISFNRAPDKIDGRTKAGRAAKQSVAA